MEPIKKGTVTLEVAGKNITQSFSISHAERLLGMRNNGGWQLPEKSKYTFDSQNGIRTKSTKREAEGSGQ